jgi:hypothetical protein
MTDAQDATAEPDRLVLSGRSRWIVVGGLSLLALPVAFSFAFFALVAADGCVADCGAPEPRPWLAVGLALGAAVMGGGWAGLVPWALGRPDLLGRTVLAGAAVLLVVVGATALLG